MRDIEELSDEECKLETNDLKEHSLTTEERDDIIRKYNADFLGESSKDTREIQEIKEREVKFWKPQIKGTPVDSEEEVITILQDLIPGIFKHQRFDNLRHQISMHMRTTHEFGHRNRVTYREIADFAKQNEYPSSTIEAWVLQGVQPNSYRIINENALTREKAEFLVAEMRERLHGLDTQARLDKCLNAPHHEMRTKTLPYFKKDYENACGFYRFLDELGGGGVLSDIAKRVGIDRLDARRYIEEKSIPRVIRKVLNQSLDEVENIERRQLIKDEVQYEQLLCRHPHVLDMEGFSDMDSHMRGYLHLKEMQQSDTIPDIPQEELAEMLNISGDRLNLYLSGKSAPKLQSTLLLHEDLRLIYEGKLPPLAFESRVEPELVFRELHQYKDLENPDIDTLASSIRTIYEKTGISSNVRWLDLHRYAPTGQEWFKGVANFCENNRSEIEHALNQQLGLDKNSPQRLRLGVISSRVYLRLENIQETDWMQLYNDEMFHFQDQETVDVLLSMTKERLDIKGDISLSRLVHQVTDYDKSMTKQGMNTDLHFLASYVKGSTLSMLLDSCDMTIQDIANDIASIGRIDRRLIRNPRFSDDALEIDKAFARLFGAGLSDGHIDQFRVFCYCEADIDRVNIFKIHVEFFGDVDYTETIDEKGTHDLRYACVLGRMLEKRGFTVGDKTVQNRGIPDFILNGPIEVQVEYLKQLWPEDGEFVNTDDGFHKYFRWTRAVAFVDPEKDMKYNIDRAFAQEIVSLIQKYGTYTEKSSFPNRESYPRYILTSADLSGFAKCKDTTVSEPTSWLYSFIESNKPLLMRHEQALLDSFGVDTRDTFDDITYYVGTGRVSVLFRAATRTLDDAMLVAIIAPPDDKRKRMKVVEWVLSNLTLYQRVRNDVLANGYQISLKEIENPSYNYLDRE